MDYLSNHYVEAWAILSVVLFLFELTSGEFVFCCFAIAAAGTAFFSLFVSTVSFQLGIFLVLSVLSLYFVRSPLKKMLLKHSPGRKSNTNALIGKKCKTVETIDNDSNGAVKVYGEIWKARSLDNSIIEKGTMVRIVEMDGLTLIVTTHEIKFEDL